MDWTQKNILVVGCGISGIGATELLEKMGACPILYDENEKVEKGQSIGTVGNSAVFEIADEPHLHFEMIKTH